MNRSYLTLIFLCISLVVVLFVRAQLKEKVAELNKRTITETTEENPSKTK